ncbi:hypothetical protein Tco_0283157 [Tanacetum coccineum]
MIRVAASKTFSIIFTGLVITASLERLFVVPSYKVVEDEGGDKLVVVVEGNDDEPVVVVDRGGDAPVAEVDRGGEEVVDRGGEEVVVRGDEAVVDRDASF